MSFFSTVAHVTQVLINWFWATIDGSFLHRGIARLAYFPSILRMTLMEGPKRRWYDRIDNTIILGALPFRSQTKKVKSLKLSVHYFSWYRSFILPVICSWSRLRM